MATYVCSDIHGMHSSYIKMFKEIDFKSNDKMYILGDVIDRGSDGLLILEDIMSRDNVDLLIGNHELFIINTFQVINETEMCIDENTLDTWLLPNNGGYVTCSNFLKYDYEKQSSILDYLRSRLLIKIVELNGIKYHLSHSSTIKNLNGTDVYFVDVDSKTAFGVVWYHVLRHGSTGDSYSNYSKDYTYISGHVPVQRVGHSKYYRTKNIIDIDCGCAYGYESSSLCCLRLDDMNAFYIK